LTRRGAARTTGAMGMLLKIVLVLFAAATAWLTLRAWLRRVQGPGSAKPADPPRNKGPGTGGWGRKKVVAETEACTACGAYVSAGGAACGRGDCPRR